VVYPQEESMNQARKLQRRQQAQAAKTAAAPTPGENLIALLKKSIESTEALVKANQLLTQENADLRERIRKLDEEVSITLQEHEERLTALDGRKVEDHA
jgi:hypothetical protein